MGVQAAQLSGFILAGLVLAAIVAAIVLVPKLKASAPKNTPVSSTRPFTPYNA
jgi:hypothetical protein